MSKAAVKDRQREREARHFMRHLVPIYYDLRRGGQSAQTVHTAFVFSVYGRWLLMTAGHCIDEVDQARAEGWEIEKCRLVDCLGLEAQHTEPVPLAYDAATPQRLCKDESLDYGIMLPPHNTCALLEANGVVPFNEQWWSAEPESVEAYYLFGVPGDSIQASPNHVTLGPAMMRLEKLAEPSEHFEGVNALKFYGAVVESPHWSLKGFSGGSILSFGRIPGETRTRYWLHAMQVGSLRAKYVSGMLMRPLGDLLKEICEGKHLDRRRS